MASSARYRSRRYTADNHQAALRHIEERANLSIELGGLDKDIESIFLTMLPDRRNAILGNYRKAYGEAAYKYAMSTLDAWKAGKVQMGGQTAKRLLTLVPAQLSESERLELVKKLHVNFADLCSKHAEQPFPDYLVSIATWLNNGDIAAANAMLATSQESIPLKLEPPFQTSENSIIVKTTTPVKVVFDKVNHSPAIPRVKGKLGHPKAIKNPSRFSPVNLLGYAIFASIVAFAIFHESSPRYSYGYQAPSQSYQKYSGETASSISDRQEFNNRSSSYQANDKIAKENIPAVSASYSNFDSPISIDQTDYSSNLYSSLRDFDAKAKTLPSSDNNSTNARSRVLNLDYSLYYDFNYRPSVGQHYVSGYFRDDGTWVQGHYKTNADDSFWNNWSSAGNMNPHTSLVGSKLPPISTSCWNCQTYVDGYFRKNGTYVSGHYRSSKKR